MMPEGLYKFGPPSGSQTLQGCYKREREKKKLLSENKAFGVSLLEQHSLYLITHSKSQQSLLDSFKNTLFITLI